MQVLRLSLPAIACLLCVLGAAPASAATISWASDADGDWNTAANWDLAVVPGVADDAVIDRGGANGAPPTVSHTAGATTVQSLTNNEALSVSGSSLTTGNFSAGPGAQLAVSGGASFAANGAVSIDGSALSAQAGGQIDLSGLAAYSASLAGNASTLWSASGQNAGGPSRIDASGALSLSGSTVFGRVWQVEALAGGQIDLSGAATLADSNTRIVADGVGSLVDLSSLQGLSDSIQSIASSIEARNGGELRLSSDAAANLSIDRYRVVLDGAASTLDLSRVTNLSNSSVELSGVGAQLDLSAVSSFDTNSFVVAGGASLMLDTASYTAAGGANQSRVLSADGAGSFVDGAALSSLTGATAFGRVLEVLARRGGEVDLGNVAVVNDSNLRFAASDANSLIDLSSIESFSDTTPSIGSALEARDGGELRLRTDAAAQISIDGYLVLRDGAASTLDLSRLTNLVNSSVEAIGTGTSLDLSNVASFDANSFRAVDGANLTLHALSYAAGGGNDSSRSIAAAGTGASIDGSSLTVLTGGTSFGRNLDVLAAAGGAVDFGNVTNLVDSNVNFVADGANSLIDLASLESFADTTPSISSSIEARDGGEVRLRSDAAANLSIDKYRIVLDGAASTLDLSRLENLTNSELEVGGDPGVVVDLSNLASYDTNSFRAFDGGEITLATTSYTAAGGDDLSRFITADGPGARVDGTSVAALTGGTAFGAVLIVTASDGGQVELQNVSALGDSNVQFIAVDSGSLLDLSSLEGFSDTTPSLVATIEARDGGEVRLRSDAGANLTIDSYRIVREGATSTLDTSRVTSLTNSSVEVIGAGTTLDLTGLSSHDTNSFRAFDGASLTFEPSSYDAAGGNDMARFITANGGAARIDGTRLTSLAGATSNVAALNLSALGGGELDLRNVATITDNVIVMAAGAVSRVDLRSLASFTTAGAGIRSRIEANSAGLVQLRQSGATLLSNVDLYASQTGSIVGDRVEALGASRVLGEGTLEFNLLVNDSLLAPGLGAGDPGNITLTGDYAQTTQGVLAVDIGGVLATQFDSVDVIGSAILDGEIRVGFFDPDGTGPAGVFDPQIGDVFDILMAANIVDNGIFVASPLSGSRAWASQIVSGVGGDTLRLLVVVPEPGTFALVLVGLVVASQSRRRR